MAKYIVEGVDTYRNGYDRVLCTYQCDAAVVGKEDCNTAES